jgi:hypothetical protein
LVLRLGFLREPAPPLPLPPPPTRSCALARA